MLKPVCVDCQRFFRMKKSGVWFVESMPGPGHTRPEPGTAEPRSWVPYKVWVADLWACPGCGHEVLSGFGSGPVSEHYMPGFAEAMARCTVKPVNDC